MINKNPMVGVRMDPDEIAAIDRIAEKNGVMRAQMIRMILREFVKKWEAEN